MTQEVKEKLIRILNSEITTTYLNNITQPLGDKTKNCNVINGIYNINSFLNNIFLNTDEDDVFIEKSNNNRNINNLVINKKRINIRSVSYKTKFFFFNTFPFREGDNFNVEYNLRRTINKLNHVKYFLFIIIFYNNENEHYSLKYDFYLIPSENFNFNPKIYEKTRCGYRGENWVIKNNNDFVFSINQNILGDPIFTYSYNC